MPTLDATEFGRLAQRLNLITEDQLRESLAEVPPAADQEDMARVLERKLFLTAWQSQRLLKGDRDGYFLGGFKLLYKIASGSFGRVFRAEDPNSGMPVAVKILRRRWTDDPRKIDLFEREGKVGMAMRHPNIVQILAVNCDRQTGQYFIAMEFVEGDNLRNILAVRKKLDPKDALRVLEEATNGLMYAYSRGLTHRDIKPSNILISTQGVAKLVDFGLAAIAQGSLVESDDDTEVDRTVDYAGLERATNAKAGDIRSDMFFLGTVLYEILSGKPCLPPTRDRRARMQKQRFEKIVPLTAEDVTGPPSLFALVDRMTALDPSQRYQTPSQMLEAIRAVRLDLGDQTVERPAASNNLSIFVVESHPKLQDYLRDKLKRLGLRVLMSSDADRALQRFQSQPYQAILVDVASSGERAIDAYNRVLGAAEGQSLPLAGVVILGEDQGNLRADVKTGDKSVVLSRPLKRGILENTIAGLLGIKPDDAG
jgi:serine/threonine protein kinase